jgi:uncharacterized protein with GYD domain
MFVSIVEAPDEISVTALNLSISALGNVRTENQSTNSYPALLANRSIANRCRLSDRGLKDPVQ